MASNPIMKHFSTWWVRFRELAVAEEVVTASVPFDQLKGRFRFWKNVKTEL
jgi:hypothetical protein